MKKLNLQSPDIVSENFEKLVALFPNCVTESAEGKAIDFDLLKQELSHFVIEGNKERYQLEWPGKREAIITANLPTTKTLRTIREDSVDFDNTENLYIEGDNLEVLKLLQESYLGKIKMIYIDPPYNTGNDFVYNDTFQISREDYNQQSGQVDNDNNRLTANPESSGRFHSDWLNMMYPRIKVARNLLEKEGVIFVSIGGEELSNLTQLMDQVFGAENRLEIIPRVQKKGGNKGNYFNPVVDYILCYARNIHYTDFFTDEVDPKIYNKTETEGPRKGEKYAEVVIYMPNLDYRPNQRFYVNAPDGSRIIPPEGKSFRWSEDRFKQELENNAVIVKPAKNSKLIDENGNQAQWIVYQKRFLKDTLEKESARPNNLIDDCQNMLSSAELKKLGIPFSYPKPTKLIRKLMFFMKFREGICLDFFSGSGSTADAVLQANANDGGNRNFIQVQLPESLEINTQAAKAGFKNICEIGKERIRRAAKKIKEETNADIDYGFRVYRLDSSNMQDVYYKPQDYDQTNLDILGDNVKPDRTAGDLLAQVMLDLGLALSLKIEQVDVSGKNLFKVAENSLYACFDSGIDENFAKDIAKDKPLRIVFKDNSFKDDTAKINVKQLLKQLSPETEMKVI